MAASFPGAIKSFSAIVNGVTKLVASLFNSPYDEITAIETALGVNMANVRFGDWVSMAGGYTNIEAETDGFVVVVVTHASGTAGGAEGYTDATATPSTRVQYVYLTTTGSVYNIGFTMPVKKGHYWKVALVGAASIVSIYWIPLGG